jgi:hypothetical protein
MLFVEYFITRFIISPKEGKINPLLPVVNVLFQVIFAEIDASFYWCGHQSWQMPEGMSASWRKSTDYWHSMSLVHSNKEEGVDN